MDHLQIFLMIVNLALGTGISVYAGLTAKKFGDEFLRPLAIYSLLFNLLFLGLLMAFYAEVNQPASMAALREPAAREAVRFLVTGLEFGLVWSLWRVGTGLRGLPRSGRAGKAIFLGGAILALSYALKFAIGGPAPLIRGLAIGHSFLFENLILLEIPVLVMLFARMNKQADPIRNKWGRSFSVFYLSRYAVALLALIFFSAASSASVSRFFVRTVVLIACNFIPLVWLKGIFLPARIRMSSVLAGIPSRLEDFYAVRRVTAREQEIIRLLLAGHRNKKIAAELFIAESTVKNHVHSIFEKLGVGTRVQLISTILENDPDRRFSP